MFNEVFDYLPLAATINGISMLIKATYFACIGDCLLIFILFRKLRILIGYVKYLLLGDLEI